MNQSLELSTKFHLPEDCKSNLEKYYLLKWKGDYLESQITPTLTLTHQNVEYKVKTLKDEPFDPNCQYKLSFRKPINGVGIVLIKKVYAK